MTQMSAYRFQYLNWGTTENTVTHISHFVSELMWSMEVNSEEATSEPTSNEPCVSPTIYLQVTLNVCSNLLSKNNYSQININVIVRGLSFTDARCVILVLNNACIFFPLKC